MKSKKQNFVICFLIFLVSSTSAQITFQKTYGGALDDVFYSVQQIFDGGYIMAGYTNSFGAGGYDVYLIKTDSTGDTLWTRTYGGIGNDIGYCVQQTADSGYIITGYTQSFGPGNRDIYVIKTDAIGNIVWTKTFGNTNWDTGLSVKQTIDGGFIVFGTTEVNSLPEFCLIKTNPVGDTLWTKSFEVDVSEFGGAIEQTTDSGYIITGTIAGISGGGVYLRKTDVNGNLIWKKTFHGINGSSGSSVQQTPDGGYIAVGNLNILGPNSYLIKTDSFGDTLWTKAYGGDSSEAGWSIRLTDDSGFIIAGLTKSFGAGDFDAYLIKTDSTGDTLWTKTYGGISDDGSNSIQQTLDGGNILSGATNSFGAGGYDGYLIKTDAIGNSGCNENNTTTLVEAPATIIESPIDTSLRQIIIINSPQTLSSSGSTLTTFCLSNGVSENISSNEIIIYPNPSCDFFSINSNAEHKIKRIRLFNILGEIFYSEKIDNNQKVINCKDFPNGIYFVSVEIGNKIFISKLIISK